MTLAKDIQNRVDYWTQSTSFDAETQNEVKELVKQGNEKELTDRFYRDLAFGTGGMRGMLGAGSARVNLYTIRKATYALATYLKSLKSSETKVAISFDSRHFSEEFAKACCEVLYAYGIKSIITKEMRPVPMLSFMVRQFACDAGICITASHNPPEYNGFKVYWACGGQLTPPHDKHIMDIYNATVGFDDIDYSNFDKGVSEGYIHIVDRELDDAYFESLSSLPIKRATHPLKIVYSPLHGTGVFAVPRALQLLGFEDIHLVRSQSTPDGNFPTVSSPNPEDPECLERALSFGESIDADLVLATDPDSDRIGAVVRENGAWRRFNGNQLGSLFFNYILSNRKKEGSLGDHDLTIKTIVTTDLQQRISSSFGVPCEETLTGFKWICERVEAYESGERKPYRSFVCGGEESYGFLAGTFVRDKDAVMACALAASMQSFYLSLGKQLTQVLDDLFLEHGVFHETLDTLTLKGKEGSLKIASIMKFFRSEPLDKIGRFKVIDTWDYEKGRGEIPPSDVIQFFCEGAKITIRPSGTEPKMKIYVSAYTEASEINSHNLEEWKQAIKDKAETIATEFVALAKRMVN